MNVVLQLLRSCGMLSEAELKRSPGTLLRRELSSQDNYTSVIF